MTSPLKPSNRGSMVWIAVVAVVVVLGIAAVVFARSSNDEDATPVKGQVANVVVGEATSTTAAPTTATDDPSSAEAGAAESAESAPALAEFTDPQDDPAVGKTIPTISGTTLDGEPLTIGPDGKAKIIAFVAHWCPHCQREVPLLVEHLKDSPMPDDVELLTVSTSVQPDAGNYPPKEWLDDEGWTAPVLADSATNVAASTFGLSSFPYFVVVDAEGKVVFRISGEISAGDFDRLMEAAQTGTSPA